MIGMVAIFLFYLSSFGEGVDKFKEAVRCHP